MRFIISPAKKMLADEDFAWRDLSLFVDRAATLLSSMQTMDKPSLQKLWKCSDALATLNFERLEDADVYKPQAPALFTYNGIQYQHLAPKVMTQDHLDYLQQHLRILSGLYGVLRPFDGVTPYRLEMQAKLAVKDTADLYGFWGRSLFETLAAETDTIVNLASVEYARAVTPFAEAGHAPRIITCLFGDKRDGKLVQRATQAKAARGMFMRWCAENNITTPDQLPAFNVAGFALDQSLSNSDTLVFIERKGHAHQE